MKYKLIVETPSGTQELIKVEMSGRYYDDSKVIWDERVDGSLPSDREQHVGYLKRSVSSGNLVIDTDRKNMLIAGEEMAAVIQASADIVNNRRNEYPSMEEVLHVILDDGIGSPAYIELQQKRALVKAKYPKES